MKKHTIKLLALVLVVAMAVSVCFAGCNNAGPVSTTAPAAGNNEPANTTPSATEPAEKTGSITVMVYDRGTMPSSEGTLNDNRWTTWIRENCPVAEVNFVSIPKAEAPETMSALFASGEAPDLLPNYEALLQFNQNGMCLEITDEMLEQMPNYSAMLEAYPMMEKSGKVDGKRVYFCKFSNIMPNHTVVIRADWLENLGLELPKTDEDLYNIIYAFTYDDPDGNGVDDTWGINMTTDAQRVLSHMYGWGNGGAYSNYAFNEDGELYYVWDRMESWLTFCKKVVDNGCCNPDFTTMKGDDDQADFLSGKIGIYCSGRFTNSSRDTLWKNFKANFPDATLDTFALPETEYGQYSAYANGGASMVGFINSDIEEEDLDAVLAYADWLYDPAVSEYLYFGEDGVYYKKNEEGTHALVADSKTYDTEYSWSQDYNVMKNELFLGSETATNAHADDFYNVYLSGTDPIMYEFGDLLYKMFEIANNPDTPDPRKWQNDGMPELPTNLALIGTTAGEEVKALLKASLIDLSKTAAQCIQEAKDAWYNAGGQQVDDYFAKYYAEAGDSALLMDDFTNAKSAPVMTEVAKANSSLFN